LTVSDTFGLVGLVGLKTQALCRLVMLSAYDFL
jgi:hypothetical protein